MKMVMVKEDGSKPGTGIVTKPFLMQSSAKENYMLTDGDLKKLGSITRSNPRKKDWSAMRLYLQSQVSTAIQKAYGNTPP